MHYYDSIDFYLDLKHFMRDDFACIRKAYLFNILTGEDNIKLNNYVKSLFPEKFLNLVWILRKKHRADKVCTLLANFLKKAKDNLYHVNCYVETHEIFDDEKLVNIEQAIIEKFQVKNLNFQYKVNPDLIFGITIRLNFKIYHLDLSHFLTKIHCKIVEDLKIKGDI